MKGCSQPRDELSALVDGALAAPVRDRLLGHLVGCHDCRAEVAELRRLRDRVRSAAADSAAPHHLTHRLTAIAGEGRSNPLYARPFDTRSAPGRHRGTGLPSRRRRLRRMAAGTLAGGCLGLAGVVGVGWAAAPPTRTPALDPAPIARSEFAAVLAAGGLGNPAVAAARGTDRGGPRTEAAVAPGWPAADLQSAGAAEQLDRAEFASRTVAQAGTQLIQVRHLNGFWTATADVQSDPRSGSQVLATGSDRQQARVWWPAIVADHAESAERIAIRYRLRTGPGPQVAGLASTVVEASDVAGQPVARWWLDRDTGVVLWEQTFDESGRTVLSAGWQEVRIGAGATVPVQARTMSVTAALSTIDTSPRHTPAMIQQGWFCTASMSGLELVELRRGTVGGGQGEALHTVYSDGITTLGVLQQRGALAGAPEGFVWDPALNAYRGLGITTMVTWQSGNTVYTVVTDGSIHQAAGVMAALPHDPPVLRTRTERILDGWQRILGGGR